MDQSDDAEGTDVPVEVRSDGTTTTRERLEESAERAVEELDRGVIDVLDWLLETETRSRIYVQLRTEPDSTSEEIAEGTGLYPSTVREALAELHEEGVVVRDKRINEGAGNNPYEYRAIPPSELVTTMANRVQDQLNRLFNLDAYLREDEPTAETEPITISVDEAEDEESDVDSTESSESAEPREDGNGEGDEGDSQRPDQ